MTPSRSLFFQSIGRWLASMWLLHSQTWGLLFRQFAWGQDQRRSDFYAWIYQIILGIFSHALEHGLLLNYARNNFLTPTSWAEKCFPDHNGVQMCCCRLQPSPQGWCSPPKQLILSKSWTIKSEGPGTSWNQLNIQCSAANILNTGALSTIAIYVVKSYEFREDKATFKSWCCAKSVSKASLFEADPCSLYTAKEKTICWWKAWNI